MTANSVSTSTTADVKAAPKVGPEPTTAVSPSVAAPQKGDWRQPSACKEPPTPDSSSTATPNEQDRKERSASQDSPTGDSAPAAALCEGDSIHSSVSNESPTAKSMSPPGLSVEARTESLACQGLPTVDSACEAASVESDLQSPAGAEVPTPGLASYTDCPKEVLTPAPASPGALTKKVATPPSASPAVQPEGVCAQSSASQDFPTPGASSAGSPPSIDKEKPSALQQPPTSAGESESSIFNGEELDDNAVSEPLAQAQGLIDDNADDRLRPLSQAEMKRLFNDRFKKAGIRVKKDGKWRIARPARMGEVILTVVDGELFGRNVVSEEGSMVIIQDSIDRELYVLTPGKFQQNYKVPGREISGATPEAQALRSRGFKHYERTGELMIYQVTEDDLKLVPSGLFQVPFSTVPQPLRVGYHLVTETDFQMIYVSRNAEQIYASELRHTDLCAGSVEVHFIYASPLDAPELNIGKEMNSLFTSGANIRLTAGTKDNLTQLKKTWNGEQVLHVSAHGGYRTPGQKDYRILLEKANGQREEVSCDTFLDYAIGRGGRGQAPRIVVLNMCDSEKLAELFLDPQRGVRRLVAVKGSILDTAARVFTESFYNELRWSGTEDSAFDAARQMMRVHENPRVVAAAEQLVLLPAKLDANIIASFTPGISSASLVPNIGMRVPFAPDEGVLLGPLVSFSSNFECQQAGVLNDYYRQHVKDALALFITRSARIVRITGKRGSGKATCASQLVRFTTLPGGRYFSAGAIVLSTNEVISQEQMREMFLPILLERGTRISKQGQWRLARPARYGEDIPKVEDGRIVAMAHVSDEHCMIIRQESVDRELYVLDHDKFAKNFKTPGVDIKEEGLEWDKLRERDFKYYERRGELIVYKVTEKDMKAFKGGDCQFEVPFSSVPQKLEVGDPLVTTLPGMEDVYVSRNADQIYGLSTPPADSPAPAADAVSTAFAVASTVPAAASTSAVVAVAASPPASPMGNSKSLGLLLAGRTACEEEARQEETVKPELLTRAKTVPALTSEMIARSPLVALKDAIQKESSKHERLTAKWYGQGSGGKTRSAARRFSGIEPMEHWFSGLPEDCRGLCVLFGGETHLVHADCRNHLLSILRKYPQLCLLIVTNDGESADGGSLRLNPADQQEFVEIHMALPPLTDQEAAQLFHEQVNRRVFRWGEICGPNHPNANERIPSAAHVLKALEKHAWIKKCNGSPGFIIQAAECNNKGQPMYTEFPNLETSWD